MTRTLPACVLLFVAVWLVGCAPRAVKVMVPEDVLLDTGIVPNGSFEAGQDAPTDWRVEQCPGQWSDGARSGSRAVSVTGDGRNDGYWRCTGLKLKPRTAYRFAVYAKAAPGANGGCLTMGTSTNNRDADLGESWTRRSFVFVTPDNTDDVYVRCGQWQVAGTVSYDDVSVREVMAVHARVDGLVLGKGERIAGGTYVAEPDFQGEGTNEFRGLVSHTAGFNSYRWVFGPGRAVTYVHRAGQIEQTSGTVSVNIGYYQSGELHVEVGKDGERWTPIGRLSGVSSKDLAVPALMYPTTGLWVRLRALGGSAAQGDSAPGSFQVYGYRYEAALAGKAPDAEGDTSYVEVLRSSPDVCVVVDRVSGARAGEPTVGGTITSTGALRVANVGLTLPRGGPTGFDSQQAIRLRPCEPIPFSLPITLERPGRYEVLMAVGDGAGKLQFAARTTCALSVLHAANYGYLVTSDDRSELWWCEGTYKISRRRPAPKTRQPTVRLLAAGNEYEPFQLVLRPQRNLKGVRVEVSDLTSGADRIDRSRVTVDRVAYVYVRRPTDAVGCVGDWPDPLPPCDKPFDVPAGENQPLWITVHVPKEASAGTYEGTVTLRADSGAEWTTPVRLRVLGFSLPKSAHVFATFGFDPSNVRRYHNLETDAELRGVYDLYMQNFAAHRIGPYDPMALDPMRVSVKTGLGWEGGVPDKQVKASGAQSLRVVDGSTGGDVSARGIEMTPVDPKAKYVVRWKVKTEKPGQECMVTICHYDRQRQFIPHHNIDIVVTGSGGWDAGKREVELRSDDARFVLVVLRPTRWTERGERTGTAWFDDVSLKRVGEDRELLADPGFETAVERFEVDIDFGAFDRAAKRYLDEFGFQRWRLPIEGMGSGTFHSRSKGSIGGFVQGTPEYETLMGKYLGRLQSHLIEHGWMDRPYAYWFDEPTPKDYEFVKEGMAILKRHAPRLTRMLTEQPEEALFGSVDLWCPVTAAYRKKACQDRQAKGEHVMWYVCTGPKEPYATLFTDHPAIDLRMWLWQTYQYNIEGILVWQSNYWTSECAYPEPNYQNPWQDPMSWLSGYDTPIGTNLPWGNGDGRFLYPPNTKGAADKEAKYLCGPVNSIRWEMLREGIEDFEYLWQLRHAVQTLRKRGVKGADVDEAERLTVIPKAISRSLTQFTWDPRPLYDHRAKVAAALEGLFKQYGLKISERQSQ